MNNTKIYEGEYLGIETVEFECGGYKGAFTVEGANLIRFDYMPLNVCLMHTTNDLDKLRNSRIMGMPILFFPNRIKNGTFCFDGREYHFPINSEHNNHIHGLLNGYTKWKIIKKDLADGFINITFEYIHDKDCETYKFFDYRVKILYENVITSSGLFQRISFENMSERKMPFCFAYHTTFNVPFNDSPEDGFFVQANLKSKYETEYCIPTGKMLELDDFGKKAAGDGCRVNEYMLDNLYLRDNEKSNKAVITDRATGIKAVYEAESKFKHFVIYNNDAKKKFLSIEPQTCCNNALNSDMETANVISINPGEEINLCTKLYVEK